MDTTAFTYPIADQAALKLLHRCVNLVCRGVSGRKVLVVYREDGPGKRDQKVAEIKKGSE